MDLDVVPSLAPARESIRTSVVERKNALCTRGVIVYRREAVSEENILGEVCVLLFTCAGAALSYALFKVIIHPKTTLAEVRQMIRDELGIDGSFVLRKNSIPLPRNQDSKLACWFFSASDDVLIVVDE